MTSAVSVKERLKRQAVEEGKTVQDKLITYGLERAIYRISVSDHADRFTLKGGIFLYALFDGKYTRATKDIDFLAQHIPNDLNEMSKVFYDIFSISCDDAIIFDLNSLTVTGITEFKEYHGVNVSIMGYLDRTRVPVSIDISFGDVIYPERVQMKFPVLLNMAVPEVYVYSIYSVIAEKFEAIVSLGFANSRYKDFYDIYALACTYNLKGIELRCAIIETFAHRHTNFCDIVAFEPDFVKDSIGQNRWNAFIKKKKAMLQISFSEAMDLIKGVLEPVVISIKSETLFDKEWNKEIKQWM